MHIQLKPFPSLHLQFQKSLQIDLNRYIWSYKPSKVKHLALIGNTNEGGLSSIDVESKCEALRLTWIGRILTGIGWNDIIIEYLKPVGGLLFLLKCNYETKLLSCFVPTFYKQMLEIFFVDMSYAIIWNNTSILIQNKSIYLKEWVERELYLFRISLIRMEAGCHLHNLPINII